jgi:DNA polymerase (family 10)
MHAEDAAQMFDEIARLLEFRGENPFKIRAYDNAARTLRELDEPIDALIAEDRLEDLPGIGTAIAQKIIDLATTGSVPLYERLVSETPIGVVDLLRVPGLGPKRARAAYDTLGIDSLDALKEAAADGSLAGVAGFGDKMSATVLANVDRVKAYAGQFLGVEAREVAELLAARLQETDAASTVVAGGGARRRAETVRRIVLVAAGEQPAAIVEAFIGLAAVHQVVESEAGWARVQLTGGLGAELRAVTERAFPFALLEQTGNTTHWTSLQTVAESQGQVLTSQGIVDANGTSIDCGDEPAVYSALGLSLVPPEMREGRGEIDAAVTGTLPELVRLGDIKGVIHCHTTWSDGRASVDAMARAALERGYQYLVICDHGPSSGGPDADGLIEQREEIEEVDRAVVDFNVLAGIEVDILKDGRLDLPNTALAELDCVVAAVHSHFGLPRDEQTARYCRAIANPHVDILGHPTGRQLLARSPIDIDMARVLDAVAEHEVAIEINGQPKRLDLGWRWHRPALERGIKFVIAPDAHGPETIDYLEHGIAMARKGGLTANDILNTQPVETFLQSLETG